MPLRSAKSGKARAATGPEPEANASHPAGLDRYDVAILAALQSDARLSNADLAVRIGLSAAPTWRRVKWLEQNRYITGYRAELGPVLAAHMDVNAIDVTGAGDDATELEILAADNVKRVVRAGGEQSPWEISAFLEMKTVWHPIGV